MAKPSKLDRAIADAMARWEEAKAEEKTTGAVLQALLNVRDLKAETDVPKVRRTRKPKGLPKPEEARPS